MYLKSDHFGFFVEKKNFFIISPSQLGGTYSSNASGRSEDRISQGAHFPTKTSVARGAIQSSLCSKAGSRTVCEGKYIFKRSL